MKLYHSVGFEPIYYGSTELLNNSSVLYPGKNLLIKNSIERWF